MSKIIFFRSFFILITILFLPFIFLKQAYADVSISNIGGLKIEEAKEVTVSGLISGKEYFWNESKVTSVIPSKGYTSIFADCQTANDKGEIRRNIGPLSTPGLYLLAISRASTSDNCRPSGIPLASQDFSVGEPTGKSCCTPLSPVYDKDKNICKKDAAPIRIGILPFIPILPTLNPEIPTECKNEDSFCEPESLQCFTAKTEVKYGKICKVKGPDFDPKRHIDCTSAAGIPCGSSDSEPGISTAIGCIHTNPTSFVKDFLKFIVGIAGGLAFLMMLMGAFQMITSAGNPDTLSAGRERFKDALIGLLFVIFSILLLQILGVGILVIPGFS